VFSCCGIGPRLRVRAAGQAGAHDASASLATRSAVRSSPHEAREAKPTPLSNGSSTSSANRPTRSSTAATVTTPWSRPLRCARTLDHGQSLGSLDQASAHGIKRDITDSGDEMLLIHRHRAEPRLPEMPGPAVTCIVATSDAPVQIAGAAPQPRFVLSASRRRAHGSASGHKPRSQRRPSPPRCRAGPDKADHRNRRTTSSRDDCRMNGSNSVPASCRTWLGALDYNHLSSCTARRISGSGEKECSSNHDSVRISFPRRDSSNSRRRSDRRKRVCSSSAFPAQSPTTSP
jgi:hypothetical protein